VARIQSFSQTQLLLITTYMRLWY